MINIYYMESFPLFCVDFLFPLSLSFFYLFHVERFFCRTLCHYWLKISKYFVHTAPHVIAYDENRLVDMIWCIIHLQIPEVSFLSHRTCCIYALAHAYSRFINGSTEKSRNNSYFCTIHSNAIKRAKRIRVIIMLWANRKHVIQSIAIKW